MQTKRIGKWLGRAAAAAGVALAAYLIQRGLSRHSPEEIWQSLQSVPPVRLTAAILLAACSYFCLTFFDWLGLRYAGRPLPWRRAALASFTSLSIGHNVGLAALSSGAVRYRFYSRWGLGAEEIGKVVAFSGLTVGVGLATLGGVSVLLDPQKAADLAGIGRAAALAAGIACLGGVAVWLGLCAFVRKPLRIRGWTLEFPQWRLACGQIAAGSINFGFVAGALYQTLAAFVEAGYFEVASVYVLANSAALVSHVPGGLGVIEATVVYLLPGAALIGALIAFRFAYFFLPLPFGLLILLYCEHRLAGASGAAVNRNRKEERETDAPPSRA